MDEKSFTHYRNQSVSSLDGKRVLITRPRPQADELIAILQSLGAVPVVFPTITIAPPVDAYRALDAALLDLCSFNWGVFTSVNGVIHVWERLKALNISPVHLKKLHLAAIGPATKDALLARGLSVEIVPQRYIAEALLTAIPNPAGLRFLLPRAAGARDILKSGLLAQGAEVIDIHAYRALPVQLSRQALAELDDGVDYLTFTSSSTVRNFCRQVDPERIDRLCQTAQIVVIGPVTAATAREEGLQVNAVADEYTIAGLVNALKQLAG